MGDGASLALNLRSQMLTTDARGRNCWQTTEHRREVPAGETALLICDMWDDHRCRGAAERVAEMAPRMNEVVKSARDRGLFIIHSPSDTMAFYEGTPGRLRMTGAAATEPPPDLDLPDASMPFDTSKGNCDTGQPLDYRPQARQHPAIEIDHERDGVSDNGREIYSAMRERGIRHLVIMGVHTNHCILNRSFAIKQMRKWGVDVTLVRDMTDCMYDPAKPPYVSHEEGTALVIGYIEKFWCPTIASADLL